MAMGKHLQTETAVGTPGMDAQRAGAASKSTRIVEWIKTSLIALLSASALLLVWQTGIAREFVIAIPFLSNVAVMVMSGAAPSEPVGAVAKEAARPLCIVITTQDGGRYASKYDTAERNVVYDRTSSILGEVLGSSADFVEVGEDEWRAALSGQGLYYEYVAPVKLSVLDGWLYARTPNIRSDASLRRVFVAFGEDRSSIYYQDADSGIFFGADTASAAGTAQELGVYTPNGARFAFETGVASSEESAYMVILPGDVYSNARVTPAGGAEQLLDVVIDAAGHRTETNRIYYDAAGTLVCVGTQFNIRLYNDGRAVYRHTGIAANLEDTGSPGDNEGFGVGGDSGEGAMIEMARIAADSTVGRLCGAAEVFFESIEYYPGDVCTVYFTYYFAGGRVLLANDGFAAKVTLNAGEVAEMELHFLNFAIAAETTLLLPELQTFAAAGGEFMLCYSDAGADTFEPFWQRR
jgi:hypothetical protein